MTYDIESLYIHILKDKMIVGSIDSQKGHYIIVQLLLEKGKKGKLPYYIYWLYPH
jgi:hypothetical protein